jgi:predicted membrane-bound dolichyl-phosphate-mannose-protein mannosyltransferase
MTRGTAHESGLPAAIKGSGQRHLQATLHFAISIKQEVVVVVVVVFVVIVIVFILIVAIAAFDVSKATGVKKHPQPARAATRTEQ